MMQHPSALESARQDNWPHSSSSMTSQYGDTDSPLEPSGQVVCHWTEKLSRH